MHKAGFMLMPMVPMAVCFPPRSGLLRNAAHHYWRVHREPRTLLQAEKDAEIRRGLRWVPSTLQCLERLKILGVELEREQMATKLRKAVI